MGEGSFGCREAGLSFEAPAQEDSRTKDDQEDGTCGWVVETLSNVRLDFR